MESPQQSPPASDVRQALEAEIRRVRLKGYRWGLMAKRHPRTKGSFLRPAEKMLRDCLEAEIVMATGDSYAMAVILDDLRGYNDDD